MKKKLLPGSVLILFFGLGLCFSARGQLTINSPTTFTSLDNNVVYDSDPAVGTFQYTGNLTIASGGSITSNDVGLPGNSADDMNIVVTGNLYIQTGGSILAENNSNGGSGGNITISVGGDLTMETGATISSSKTSGAGDTGIAGNIEIDVQGVININAGAVVKANSTGPGGDITITGQKNITIAGTVQSNSGTTGNGLQGGGSIFIITICSITIESGGIVSSRGLDPGADLVHLQGCIVTISGLVESTGQGHVVPNAATKVIPPYRPDKPANSTAGIEVWAYVIIINSTGEVNADLPLGAGKRSWIDLFARNNININGPSTGTLYVVHANIGGNGGEGGIITVKSVEASVNTSGHAIQSNGHGSGIRKGGPVAIEANNDLNLTGSQFQATGANIGGTYSLKASTGNINMDITTTITVTVNGFVNNTACGTVGTPNYSAGSSVVTSAGTCTAAPLLPVYATLPPSSCILIQDCNQNTLPVSLVSFTAMRNNTAVLLNWKTETEIDNRGFEIQRKLRNNRDFETLSFVTSIAPGGNSSVALQYSYTDLNSFADVSFYRLKQYDFAGHIKYSEIRMVDGLKNKIAILAYPNPSFDGVVNVIFNSDHKKDISLLDISGRVLKTWKENKDQQMKITGLMRGTYLLRVIDLGTNETQVQKIVVSH